MNTRRLILIALISSTRLCAQVPNSGLELWTENLLLAGWHTNSNPLTEPPYEPYIVQKDSDSYAGEWAANLIGNGVFKSFATTTFPVSIHPDNLSLHYKLHFPPCVNEDNFQQKDTVSVLVELFSGGVVVDQGSWMSITGQPDYSQLVVPVSQNATVFDSCRITLMGGRVNGGCGIIAESTSFVVDEIQLKYSDYNGCIDPDLICLTCLCTGEYAPVCACDGVTYSNICSAYVSGHTSWTTGACDLPTQLPSVHPSDGLHIFPNPAGSVVTITMSGSGTAPSGIEMLDMQGRVVLKSSGFLNSVGNELRLDVEQLDPGIYFIRVMCPDKGWSLKKLIKS